MWQAARALVLCVLWMCIGPSLILLNKHILYDLEPLAATEEGQDPTTARRKGFNYPIFLSALGVLTTTLMAYVTVHVLKYVKLEHEAKVTRSFYVRNLVSIGVCSAFTLAFGNWVYLYLTVAFIQMLKAFNPVIILLVGKLTGIESFSFKVVCAVMGICAGVAVASFGEVNFSVIGVLLMLASETGEAFRLILTQRMLKDFRFGIIEGHYWIGPLSSISLFVLSGLLEMPRMVRDKGYLLIGDYKFLFIAAATLGLGVQLLTFMVLQVTGGLTLKILGTVRNALLVIFSVYAFGEKVTSLEMGGYSIAICAFVYYTYLKATAG